MEFDGVILVKVNEESFPTDDLHSRLLYVLLTRSQQEVRGFYHDTPTPLLAWNIKSLVKAASRFDDIL
jgi:DNA helicase II / ATP-dependent DNA helicase PcrA